MTSTSELLPRNGLPGTASTRDTSRSASVAAAISQRSRCDGGRRSARRVCPASSALSSTSAAMPPGRFPASVAELDQNTAIISAMTTA